MTEKFQLTPVWDDENFLVQKGVLEARAKLPGVELGHGLIYYPGVQTVRHRLLPDVVRGQPILEETRRNFRYLWNPGHISEIVNEGRKPIDLVCVKLNYDPKLTGALSEDSAAAATAHLLHGRWPQAFKSALRTDLEAIGRLATPFVNDLIPSAEDILRATRAKEDLEFKLAWFAAASIELGMTSYSFWSPGVRILGGSSRGSPSFDPSVTVTVNTKSADGTRDVPGWRVWANAYASTDPKGARPFERLSTPTTGRLDVGKYNMWAEKGELKGEILPVSVGNISAPFESEQTVDLLVREK